jgi:hypothetical protein
MNKLNRTLRVLFLATFAFGGAGALAGCNESGDDLSRVQTNLVDKKIFEGDWWYTRTNIDVDGDEANASLFGVFEGNMSYSDLGVDKGESIHMARIRWVIDENYLYAYRAYELIQNGNDDGKDPKFLGQPLAAFPIENHVDIRYEYSGVTGELSNVKVENTTDRRWYERSYMRVDWSRNDISTFYVGAEGYGSFSPASFDYQAGAHDEFPESWKPSFVRVREERKKGTDDPSRYRWVDEWPADADATVHYMSFVTQEAYSPGGACLNYGLPCQAASLTIRNAFLRVPPEHEYAVEVENNQEFDRFGTFRTYQRTYVRGGQNRESLHDHCEEDSDCGVGGKCDGDRHFCVGGITSDFGETDFLAWYRPRHNFWVKSFDGRPCVADWECDNRYGHEPANKAWVGSRCDKSAGQCTIPLEKRETRQVAYHLNAGYPAHLVRPAFEVFGEWNEAFMRGQRALLGKSVPTAFNRKPVECQDGDPTAYCFCGSAEEKGGECPWKYDPFRTPEADADLDGGGDVAPYDCYVRGPEGFAEPEHPTSYDEYASPAAYQYEFVGEECLFVLRSNSCDQNPELPCEELGDIRYQFFNYIDHGNVGFGGVSLPMVDPTTGELITANANMAATSIESVATQALEFFPVLRCEGPNGCAEGEEGAAEKYFEGDNLRQYFANRGRVQSPVAVAVSGTDGYSTGDQTRPGIPADTHAFAKAQLEMKAAKLETLRGIEGRAQIMSDRMKNLAGTPLEEAFVSSLGVGGSEALAACFEPGTLPGGAAATDASLIDRVSPFRAKGPSSFQHPDDALWEELAAKNIDPPFDIAQRARYWEYWAEAFRGRPAAEASIRVQQAFLRAVMNHEVGHSVGLRHNFAGSFDRNNYLDSYFRVAEDLPLPRLGEFDRASKGGNGDGDVLGDEVVNYLRELREVRNERAVRGAGNAMTGSIMDYNGDLSDMSGLGRYDVAAALWNHFSVIEAYEGDPVQNSDNSLNGVTRADLVPRTWWQYYTGGGTCDEDVDCPSSAGRLSVEGQPVYQRCVRNPRKGAGSPACKGDTGCVCSAFDDDFREYITPETDDNAGDTNPYLTEMDSPLFHPVNYLFCTDDRTVDISWCSRFDAGESFQEAIDHYRRQWEEAYPRSYYRRFRGNPAIGLTRSGIVDAAKIFQHLYYRIYYEPDFFDIVGPLGVDDQYFASLDAMNWLTEVAELPQSGSYRFDEDKNQYDWISEDENLDGADMTLGVGLGYPLWSQYQEGYYGFYKTERSGVFYDKYYALLALALRDWNLSFTIDERFYINFYDLWDVEMTEFFGGIILDDPRWHAPRVEFDGGEPIVKNLSWFRGSCANNTTGYNEPCRESQTQEEAGPVINGTTNQVLRNWATILALAQFPVFYDTSFEQRLSIFKRGNGDGFDLPDVQPDGDPTCAYGTIKIDPSHVTGCEEPDYVVFDSNRFRTQYVAVKARTRLAYNLDEEQIGFELLRRLVDQQDELEELEALPTPTADEQARMAELEATLNEENSFLEYLIDIQRQYGISSYISY